MPRFRSLEGINVAWSHLQDSISLSKTKLKLPVHIIHVNMRTSLPLLAAAAFALTQASVDVKVMSPNLQSRSRFPTDRNSIEIDEYYSMDRTIFSNYS